MAYYDDTPTPYREKFIEQNPARTYLDIDMSFGRHPVSKDILTKSNEFAIKQALVNLVMLNFYDKPFHPEVGGNVYRTLFENFSLPGVRPRLERDIEKVIRDHEPRVEVLLVEARQGNDSNSIAVQIQFKTLNSLTISSVDIPLTITR